MDGDGAKNPLLPSAPPYEAPVVTAEVVPESAPAGAVPVAASAVPGPIGEATVLDVLPPGYEPPPPGAQDYYSAAELQVLDAQPAPPEHYYADDPTPLGDAEGDGDEQ